MAEHGQREHKWKMHFFGKCVTEFQLHGVVDSLCYQVFTQMPDVDAIHYTL